MRQIIKNKKISLVIITMIIGVCSLVEILKAYLFGMIYDWISGTLHIKLSTIILCSIGFCFILFSSGMLYNFFKSRFLTSVIGEYRKKYIDAYLDHNRNITSAELINNSTTVMEQVERNYIGMILLLIKDILLLIGGLVVTISISKTVFVVVVGLSWIPIVIPGLMEKVIKKRSVEVNESTQKMVAQLGDIQGGYEILNTSETKLHVKKLFYSVHGRMMKNRLRFGIVSGCQSSMAETLGHITFIAQMVVGAYLASKGMITIGSVIALTQVSNYIVNPIISIPYYKASMSAVKPLMKIVDDEISKEIQEGEYTLKEVDKISISNLKFSYDKKTIFDGIDVSFFKGKKYLLCGQSGCGKSTLLKLLLRQSVGDYEGNISIDGKEICDYKTKDYFHEISYVGQHVFLFNDTVKNNILLYNSDWDGEFERVIELSNLTEWIQKLPNQENTVIGEGGQEVSGGERQRIGIARAMVKKSNVLMADEITASLDEKNAIDIEKVLLQSPGMLINVSHKVYKETVDMYDEVLEIKDGNIIRHQNYVDMEKTTGSSISKSGT